MRIKPVKKKRNNVKLYKNTIHLKKEKVGEEMQLHFQSIFFYTKIYEFLWISPNARKLSRIFCGYFYNSYKNAVYIVKNDSIEFKSKDILS